MSVFVFVVKEGFDLPCLPQDYKNKIEISELVEFFNKRLTEFFVFTAKRELDENFLSFFEEKIRNDVVILGRVVTHFNPDDGKQPKTFGLNNLIF